MSEQLLSSDPAAGLLSTDPNAASAPPKSRDFKILGVNIHVPAEEKPRPDSNMVGIGANGAGIAPEDALMVGQAARKVAQSAASGGALAGVKQAVVEASPVIKYEAARSALRYAGLPDPIAMPIAMIISGYKRGGGAAEVEGVARPSDMNAPHLDRSIPVRPSQLTEQQMRERLVYGHGEPPPAPFRTGMGTPQRAPVVEAPTSARPESVAPPAAPVASGPVAPAPQGEPVASVAPAPSTPGSQSSAPVTLEKMKLSAQEYAQASNEYLRLRQMGKTHQQATDLIQAQLAMARRMGASAPPIGETRFPKGMRGKSVPPRP